MNKRNIDMTVGDPFKLLIAFTIPMILGNVFQQVYTMVDAMVVGRFVSKEALAAVGATGAIMFLMVSIIIGFTVGTAIVTAQYAGAKNTEGIKSIFATGFWIVVVESIVLCIVGNLALRPGLILLGTPADILDQADLYLRINFSTCAAPILYNIVSQFMRSLGDSKTPLYAIVISSVTNIVLDLVFVIVFGMGVEGVAIATVIAQFVSVIFCLTVTFKKFPEYIPGKGEWKADFQIFKNILRIGIPMSLQNMLVSFGMMFVQTIINGYGTNVVAGYTAGNKLDTITLQFMNSIGTAMSTYAGQNFGARKKERMFTGLRAALILNILMGAFLTVVIVFFGKYIVLLFMESSETEAIQVAVQYLTTVGIFYILCGVSYIFTNFLRGIGHVAIPTTASLVELGAKMATSFALSAAIGHSGIWWAWPVSWITTDIILIGYYFIKAAPKLREMPE